MYLFIFLVPTPATWFVLSVTYCLREGNPRLYWLLEIRRTSLVFIKRRHSVCEDKNIQLFIHVLLSANPLHSSLPKLKIRRVVSKPYKWIMKTAVIIHIAARETSVSGHHGGPIELHEGSTDTSRTIVLLNLWRAFNWAPILPSDAI